MVVAEVAALTTASRVEAVLLLLLLTLHTSCHLRLKKLHTKLHRKHTMEWKMQLRHTKV